MRCPECSSTIIYEDRVDQANKTVHCDDCGHTAPKIDFKTNLSFQDALTQLEEGEVVAREGWNGKGMFLYLVNEESLHPTQFPNKVEQMLTKDRLLNAGDCVAKTSKRIDMKTATDEIANGWKPSNLDLRRLPTQEVNRTPWLWRSQT
jgi:hypothetical protein